MALAVRLVQTGPAETVDQAAAAGVRMLDGRQPVEQERQTKVQMAEMVMLPMLAERAALVAALAGLA